MPRKTLSHTDARGKARMVRVTRKPVTKRRAVARATIRMNRTAFAQVVRNQAAKGDVLAAANLAGVMAAKNTASLIPLCHPLNLTHVAVTFSLDPGLRAVHIEAACEIADRTGVEMEALTAAAIAALTIYDMLKGVDRSMVVSNIYLVSKKGGRSGPYRRSSRPQ